MVYSENLRAARCVDRSWDALCPDAAYAGGQNDVDSNVFIRNSGLAQINAAHVGSQSLCGQALTSRYLPGPLPPWALGAPLPVL